MKCSTAKAFAEVNDENKILNFLWMDGYLDKR